VNHRDRAYTIREIEAWGWWLRSGRTMPNTLGFRSQTCEYRIMRGIPQGSKQGATVPSKFNIDKSIELVDQIILRLPDNQLCIISGVYVKGLSQRDLAVKLDMSRGKLQHYLNKAYSVVYAGLIHPNN